MELIALNLAYILFVPDFHHMNVLILYFFMKRVQTAINYLVKVSKMNYSHEVTRMCIIKKSILNFRGVKHYIYNSTSILKKRIGHKIY